MIPNVYHFIWFGRAFPFSHYLAIRSVAMTSAPDAIVLHCSDDLRGQPHFDAAVRDVPALEPRPLDVARLLASDEVPEPARLRRAWDRLVAEKRWAALSDVGRYLVLVRDGGVYLDLDTITVRDVRPLLRAECFCGREHLLVNRAVYRSSSRLRHLRIAALDLARWYCRSVEGGIPLFARIAHLFPASINGAVLAAAPGHALLVAALARVADLVDEIDARRPVIGPDLLQELVEDRGRSDVTVFAPRFFYPLGPGMSPHLFRLRSDRAAVERAIAHCISDETYVVHWYNHGTGSGVVPADPEGVRRLREHQVFSRLASTFLPS